MNSCVHLCVCLCVRPINISTLPSSRCLYNTAVLLLLMSLPVFTWLLYWSTFWHPLQGKAGEGAVYSQNAAQDISLHFFLHWCSSNLGTNLCVVVAKIDELPDWESASVHSWGNNKSPGLLSRRAPWRVACVRLLSPPLSAPLELQILFYHCSSISLYGPLPLPHPPPPILIFICCKKREVVPSCQSPGGWT